MRLYAAIIAALLLGVLAVGRADAQSSPGFVNGQIVTMGQLNSSFQLKEDYNPALSTLTGSGASANQFPYYIAPGQVGYAAVGSCLSFDAGVLSVTDGCAGGSSAIVAETATTNLSIQTTQTGTAFNNNGATGALVWNLPTIGTNNGLLYCFNAVPSELLTITPTSGNSIVMGATVGTAGASLTTSTPNSSICLISNNLSQWVSVNGSSGTWTVNGSSTVTMPTVLNFTPLNPANNLADVSNVAQSRANLGLGSMATQAANAVAITGGTITGVTISGIMVSASDITGTIAIANGGTNSTTQTTNGVAYYNGTGIVTGSGLTWNGTDLGVGTASPQQALDVDGSAMIRGALQLANTSAVVQSQVGPGAFSGTSTILGIGNSSSGSATSIEFFPVGGTSAAAEITSAGQFLAYAGGLNPVAMYSGTWTNGDCVEMSATTGVVTSSGATCGSGGGGGGSVTSVGLSVPGSSIFGVTGSPITTLGTLGLTTTGTANEIPYFNSTSTLSSASNLFSTGTNIGIGTSSPGNFLAVSQSSGVFTNSAMNETTTSLVNGLNLATEFQGEYGFYATEGLAAGVAVPATSGVGQVNGVAGYVNSASTTINAVGGFFSFRATGSGAQGWGVNEIVYDKGFASVLNVNEIDANITSPTSSVAGVLFHGASTVTPTNAWAIYVEPLGSGVPWRYAMQTQDGAALTGIQLGGASAPAANVPSQAIVFDSFNDSDSLTQQEIQGLGTGLYISGPLGIKVPVAGPPVSLQVQALGGLDFVVAYNGSNLYTAAVNDQNNATQVWEFNATKFQFDDPIFYASLPTGTPATFACFTSSGELIASGTGC